MSIWIRKVNTCLSPSWIPVDFSFSLSKAYITHPYSYMKLFYKTIACNSNNVSVNSQSLLMFEAILGTSEACCIRGMNEVANWQLFHHIEGHHTVLFPFCSKTPYNAGQNCSPFNQVFSSKWKSSNFVNFPLCQFPFCQFPFGQCL